MILTNLHYNLQVTHVHESRPAIKNQVTEVNLSDKITIFFGHDHLLIVFLVSKYFLHRQLLLRYANLFKDMLISLSVKAKNKFNLHVSVVSVALMRTCSRTKFPQSLINLGSKGCVLLVHGTGFVQVKFKNYEHPECVGCDRDPRAKINN